MGKKKRDHTVLSQFCYYCDREYEHKETLLEHQRVRHFSCLKWPKKFSTAGSMSTHMLSVHRETLARVPNAKLGRDSLGISIYGMEGVPAILIQEKMIAKLKKKSQQLQEDIQKKTNLSQLLNPKYIKELKETNEFARKFSSYTTHMEAAAGIKYYTEQPQQEYDQRYLAPEEEESKGKIEEKRDAKYQRKLEEEKAALPIIMKEEMKNMKLREQAPEEPSIVKPALNLNISQQQKETKKGKQEIMTFVSKLSPEEKRAKMETYRYDEKKIVSKLKNLQMSIADKLNAFKKK